MLGEWAIATTTLEAGAATAGAAEPARIDPAAPSARIAEMTMLRPVRMIPPCIFQGQHPAARPHRPALANVTIWSYSRLSAITYT